jgi:hypothetical protein
MCGHLDLSHDAGRRLHIRIFIETMAGTHAVISVGDDEGDPATSSPRAMRDR